MPRLGIQVHAELIGRGDNQNGEIAIMTNRQCLPGPTRSFTTLDNLSNENPG